MNESETVLPSVPDTVEVSESHLSFLMDLYTDQQELVVFADTKVAGLLLLNGAVLAFLLAKIPALRPVLSQATSFYTFSLLALITFITLLVTLSIFFGIVALVPRMARFENRIQAPLMIFFSTITQHYPSIELYAERLKNLAKEDIAKDVSHQVVEVAHILSVKYRFIRLSTLMVGVSFPLLALFYGLVIEVTA